MNRPQMTSTQIDEYLTLPEPNWCQMYARERLRYLSLRRFSVWTVALLALSNVVVLWSFTR